jgi:ribosomal protein S12 methylthiotransferase accessory factor
MGLADPALVRLIAIAEGAERYSAGFLGEPAVYARHADLRGAALDPASIPRCSEAELANPRCPLIAFDPDAPIRWIAGTDLATGETTWVPAVMVCYSVAGVGPAERFWYRISTGYAVHTDPVEALVRGACEVIERDAVALTWLQRLPLPTVAQSGRSPALELLLRWAERHFVQAYLFDATTDLGVPTAYCLLVAEHDPRMRQAVGAATGRTVAEAAEKALREALHSRVPRTDDSGPPEDFADFLNITDGARYMGRPVMAPEFAFLTDGARERVAPDRTPLPQKPTDALARIVDTLSGAGMQAIAVDRTTRELAAVGVTAVCVVIPQLQPMSLLPLAQYRAHPRLYDAPPRMGYPSRPEEELNPWPLPFA